jgi:hypothetical protein
MRAALLHVSTSCGMQATLAAGHSAGTAVVCGLTHKQAILLFAAAGHLPGFPPRPECRTVSRVHVAGGRALLWAHMRPPPPPREAGVPSGVWRDVIIVLAVCNGCGEGSRGACCNPGTVHDGAGLPLPKLQALTHTQTCVCCNPHSVLTYSHRAGENAHSVHHMARMPCMRHTLSHSMQALHVVLTSLQSTRRHGRYFRSRQRRSVFVRDVCQLV